jgi:HEAT repeat protein
MNLIKNIILSALVLLLAGCSYGQQLSEQDNLLRNLEQKTVFLTKEVSDLTLRLNKQQKELESLKFDSGILRKELMELRSPSISPEQSQTERLSKLLQELANPSCDTNKLAFELRKFGRRAGLALIEALKTPDVEYRSRVEQVFSGLLIDDATPVLLPFLKDSSLRISIVRVLGNLKNYAVADELAGCLSSDDENFVFASAEALIKLKDKRGVPVLLDCLKNPDPNIRALAFNLLNKLTGLTLDYKYYNDGAELMDGAKRWSDWWMRNAPSFIFSEDM